jgi:hypothetical protein
MGIPIKKSVNVYQIIRCHITKYNIPHTHLRENFKSHDKSRNYGLLGYDTVQSDTQSSTFQINTLPPFCSWRCTPLSILTIKETVSSETVATIYQTIWCHKLRDHNFKENFYEEIQPTTLKCWQFNFWKNLDVEISSAARSVFVFGSWSGCSKQPCLLRNRQLHLRVKVSQYMVPKNIG